MTELERLGDSYSVLSLDAGSQVISLFRPALERLGDIVTDELNVKELRLVADSDELLDYSLKPNLKVLGPRLGRQVGAVGAALKAVKGAANPRPRARNTSAADHTGCVSANPSAAPMNGAVHGLATTTASAPVKNAPLPPPGAEDPPALSEPERI